MQAKSDAELLAEYANQGREAAFAELVQRHTNLVYSSAARQIGSAALAAEVTQQVFVSLARQSGPLASNLECNASLAGWLCRSARNLSLNHKRDEFRRNIREREVMQQLASDPEITPDWQRLSSVLDEAMGELNDADYDAVVMRFYENQDLRSVGRALGVTDDAAQKRVARALDKLRTLLSRRGITGTAGAVSVVISANAVQAAPAGLAAAISTAAVGTAAGAISVSSSATLAGTATKVIAMTTLQKAAVITVLTTAIGAAVYQARQASTFRERAAAEAALAEETQQLRLDYAKATNELASLRSASSRGLAANEDSGTELLKLRGEVAKLRRQLDEPKPSDSANQPEFNGTIGTIIGLKRKLKEMPDKDIPEIHYMDDEKWLRMVIGSAPSGPTMRPMYGTRGPGVWDVQLDNEESVRRALAQVRREAKTQFSGRIQNALQSYTKEHQGELPSDIMQLQPYFAVQPDTSVMMDGPRPRFGPDGKVEGFIQPERQYLPPVDAATLQRYEMTQTGNISNVRPSQYLVREKAPVDNDFDTLIEIGLKGYFTAGVGKQQNGMGWSGELDLGSLTPAQRESYEKSMESRRRAEALRDSQANNPPH